ncbi:type III-B CRISPR module-associated protein Cmr5 [Thalassospira povalilytica]|uniref:type III-B CRISPR module-associated protein Cmr5 n=1 Tax=Thalassospira povalilytica TaxID=732237 RepID=UPI003AA93224
MTWSLAQKRAKHALEQINSLQNADDYGKYVPYVNALPASIITSGLGQALAMERAGCKLSGHKFLFKHMLDWLGKGWERSPYKDKVGQAGADDEQAKALFMAITEQNERDYIRAQAEALEYLEWLKKFAAAFLTDPDDAVKSDEDRGKAE